MKNKYKELVKNVGLLSISNFTTKLLTFLLVPLYSRTLSQAEYGSIDIIQTTINLLAPILTLCISEAVIRFTLEESNNMSEILVVGLKMAIRGIVLFIGLGIIGMLLGISKTYIILAIAYFGVYVVSDIFNQFLKGCNQIVTLVKVSISNIVIIILFNIIFLVWLKIGIIGYFVSNIIAYLGTISYICIKIDVKKYIITGKKEKELERSMKKYSTPMIFNSIAWWINSASDKYLVLWICGVAQNGVYSMSYKIPTILMVVQNIFAQAWQISAIKEYEKKGKEEFFSIIYGIYNLTMVLGTAILIIFTKILAGFLYGSEFFEAWKYVPALLVSVIFGALSGFIGTIFSATKDSRAYAQTTVIGAISNIILNIILIPILGVMGAAISTAISYLIVWIVRIIKSRKYMNLNINYKCDILSYLILIIESVLLFLEVKYNVVINIVLTLFILVINKDVLKIIINKCKSILLKGREKC